MKTSYLILFCPIFLLSACSGNTDGNKGKANIAPFEFNDNGLQVVTTFLNNKTGMMYILYGNDTALRTAIEGKGKHLPGEAFYLITRRQAENKFWYGSVINGVYETVEEVTTSAANPQGLSFQYRLLKGHGKAIDPPQARINFILSQRPSVFP